MLQIVSGMYFRDVPLNERRVRSVFYTNGCTLDADPVELPVGRFMFATDPSAVNPVTVEAVVRLEAVRLDGQKEGLISTGSTELLNDAAAVFAFSLNVTCSRSEALVDRLVPSGVGRQADTSASKILRGTFDSGVYLPPEAIEAAHDFSTKLLALRRSYFEAAMRAIRRVVDATLLVSDDPSLAYTLFVAALESLAQVATSPDELRSWDTYHSKKRSIIDAAIADLTAEQAARVRDAVLEIDQLSLGRRFRAFTLDHIASSFYRSEAMEAIRPIRASDLPNALDVAYKLRSRNVHQLQELAPELWAISDRADTLRWQDRSVLSLEGLNRLCRHVIKRFVERSPTGVDPAFNYRDHLPGIIKVQLAPEYWIWKAPGLTVARAPEVLEGFIELLLPVLADPDKPVPVDMSDVLEKIEVIIAGENRVEARLPMIAIYVLWHAFLSPEHHRVKAAEIVERYTSDLEAPSVTGFVVHLLTADEVEWSDVEVAKLVEDRRNELRRGRGQPLPARLDAALLLFAADRLWDRDKTAALLLIGEAVEVLPGDAGIVEYEENASRGSRPPINLLDFALATEAWQLGENNGASPERIEAED